MTDEDQLGMTYADLETAMHIDEGRIQCNGTSSNSNLKRYREIRARNLHKMQPIPVCVIPKE